MKTIQFFFLFVLSFSMVSGQSSKDFSNKAVAIEHTSSEVIIDGKLNEIIWQRSPHLHNFIQFEPENRQVPTSKTEGWISYDDEALYIAVKNYESDTSLIGKGFGARDYGNDAHSDCVGILLSPYNDGVNYAYFMVTAMNVQSDMLFSGTTQDRTWDGVWYSATSFVEDGWICELKIPLNTLRYNNEDDQQWGFNIWRWIARKQEWSTWSFANNETENFWRDHGTITNISGLKSQRRFSLSPYVSGYMEKNTGESPVYSYNAGLDLKYGLSQSFTLDMMLVPDFGQVQSDDVELNLSPYETYYNEKRQFFTEGMDLFNKASIFYSRRIGGVPQKYDEVSGELVEHEQIKENPYDLQLINATKISGRTKNGLGVGLLNAITQTSKAEILDTLTGQSRFFITQPITNYSVCAVDQTFGTNSFVSVINTNYYNTFQASNVTAAELNLEDKNKLYIFRGIVGHSYNDTNEKSHGNSYSVKAGKNGGKFHALYYLTVKDDSFDQNTMGFMTQNNLFANEVLFKYNMLKPFSIFLNMKNYLDFNYFRMYKPNVFSYFTMSYTNITQFRNYYLLSSKITYSPGKSRDYYETRTPGRFLENESWMGTYLSISTNKSKKLNLSAYIDYSQSVVGRPVVVVYRIGNEIEAVLNNKAKLCYGFIYDIRENYPGFAGADMQTDMIYFGLRNQKTVVNTFEADYSMNEKMFVNMRIRHYWSLAAYDAFFELTDDGQLAASDYVSDDLNYNALNLDITYRWIFSHGSEIAINWKYAIMHNGTDIVHNYWSNVSELSHQPVFNGFSVKLLYYFDYAMIRKLL